MKKILIIFGLLLIGILAKAQNSGWPYDLVTPSLTDTLLIWHNDSTKVTTAEQMFRGIAPIDSVWVHDPGAGIYSLFKYMNEATGSDITGNGSDTLPYRTFPHLISTFPDAGTSSFAISLGPGDFKWSELAPYIESLQAVTVLLVGVADSIGTITGVTADPDHRFRYTYNESLADSVLQDARIAPVGAINTVSFPVFLNFNDTLIAASPAVLSGDYKLLDLTTNLDIDISMQPSRRFALQQMNIVADKIVSLRGPSVSWNACDFLTDTTVAPYNGWVDIYCEFSNAFNYCNFGSMTSASTSAQVVRSAAGLYTSFNSCIFNAKGANTQGIDAGYYSVTRVSNSIFNNTAGAMVTQNSLMQIMGDLYIVANNARAIFSMDEEICQILSYSYTYYPKKRIYVDYATDILSGRSPEDLKYCLIDLRNLEFVPKPGYTLPDEPYFSSNDLDDNYYILYDTVVAITRIDSLETRYLAAENLAVDSIVHDSMYYQIYDGDQVHTLLTQTDFYSRDSFGTPTARYWISQDGSDVTGDGTWQNPWGTLDAVRWARPSIGFVVFHLDFDTVSLWNIKRTIKEYDLGRYTVFSGARQDTLNPIELTRIDEYSFKSSSPLEHTYATDSGYFLTPYYLEAAWNDSITIGQWPVMYSKTDTVFAPMTYDLFDDTQWYHVVKNKTILLMDTDVENCHMYLSYFEMQCPTQVQFDNTNYTFLSSNFVQGIPDSRGLFQFRGTEQGYMVRNNFFCNLSYSAGEVMEIDNTNEFSVISNIFTVNYDNTPRTGQGMDLRFSKVTVSQNMFYDMYVPIKIEKVDLLLGGNWAKQATYFLGLEESPLNTVMGSEQSYLYHDIYVDSVDAFIRKHWIGPTNDVSSGTMVNLPATEFVHMNSGDPYPMAFDINPLGFTNRTFDVARNEFIRVGSYADSSAMSIYMEGTLTVDTIKTIPPHAAMSFDRESESLDMDQNVWVKITNATDDLFSTIHAQGITQAGDSLTIIFPGDYTAQISISFSGTTNSDLYEFAIFVNEVLASPRIPRSTTSTDVGNVSLPFYLDGLQAGDEISLRIQNTANNFDATIIACSWITKLLHAE